MKYFITLMTLVTILFAVAAQASGRVPFGHQIIPVQNYSRATEQIAISGLIGDGGAQALAAHGFKTIIDLRTATEGTADEKALIDLNGMSYINIPMTVAGISEEQLAAFTKAMETAQAPILIHCGSGNRAGAMWASYQIRKGVDPEVALAAGRKAGMRPPMEEKVRAAFID
ncbi:MAG: tyrosine-protein phosphatase [Nitrosomonas sp.]|mgnify:FL=1|nr:tyrosine-protein phosphatase [Nitrosomonas sp.]MBP6077012.1 tyrosine-protein phosphatase [Nitrosomonas sp.]